MSIAFPTSLDSLSNPAPGSPLNQPSHSSLHDDTNDAIVALETKVGIDGSTDTDSLDYKVRNVAGLAYNNDETPSGTVNGVNAAFTLASTPLFYLVFVNGKKQTEGVDFNIATATITFIAGSIPQTGDELRVSYLATA